MLKLLAPKPYKDMWAKTEMYREKGAVIGENVRLWGNLDGINPQLITIGNNVCLAARSQIITHCPISPGPVVIGDGAWIGFGVIVLPNVTIGKNSLIGAGSVVARDIPPNSIACGNPARVIRERDREELARTVALMRTMEAVGKV